MIRFIIKMLVRRYLLTKVFMLLVLATGLHEAKAEFSACPDHFAPKAIPSFQAPDLFELCFDEFAVLYSASTKTPLFTAQRYTPQSLGRAQAVPRSDQFYEEARLPRAARATLDDYRGSGYHRGHLGPSASMPTYASEAQSFSLANIVPQAGEMNSGVWAKSVESATRKYVFRSRSTVFVITGTLYETARKPNFIGNRVRVPDALYKLVYDQTLNRSWVFIVPNSDYETRPTRISYSEFKTRFGLDLLPGLNPPIK